jgi:hypothetical protein
MRRFDVTNFIILETMLSLKLHFFRILENHTRAVFPKLSLLAYLRQICLSETCSATIICFLMSLLHRSSGSIFLCMYG